MKEEYAIVMTYNLANHLYTHEIIHTGIDSILRSVSIDC